MAGQTDRRGQSLDEFSDRRVRGILGVYAAWGSGPLEVIGATFRRLIEKW